MSRRKYNYAIQKPTDFSLFGGKTLMDVALNSLRNDSKNQLGFKQGITEGYLSDRLLYMDKGNNDIYKPYGTKTVEDLYDKEPIKKEITTRLINQTNERLAGLKQKKSDSGSTQYDKRIENLQTILKEYQENKHNINPRINFRGYIKNPNHIAVVHDDFTIFDRDAYLLNKETRKGLLDNTVINDLRRYRIPDDQIGKYDIRQYIGPPKTIVQPHEKIAIAQNNEGKTIIKMIPIHEKIGKHAQITSMTSSDASNGSTISLKQKQSTIKIPKINTLVNLEPIVIPLKKVPIVEEIVLPVVKKETKTIKPPKLTIPKVVTSNEPEIKETKPQKPSKPPVIKVATEVDLSSIMAKPSKPKETSSYLGKIEPNINRIEPRKQTPKKQTPKNRGKKKR